jgi:acetyl-CoA carboxylase carboxyltransferase component
MILDAYHAMSYIGAIAITAFGKGQKASKWIENQRFLLLDSQTDLVLNRIKNLKVDANLRKLTYNYLASNRDRMDYKTYRKNGLLIGSGAIESAHRTVVQKRCKRSGQRWSILGAQRVLNLSVCWMSNRWDIVRQHIEPFQHKIAA